MIMGRITSLFSLAALLTLLPCTMSAQSSDAKTLPYVNNFDSQDDFNQFTVKDVDGDGSTWAFDSNRQAANSSGTWGTPDDWLISPALKMSADREYSVSFKTFSAYDAYNQKYNVVLGQGDDVSAYKDTLIADIVVKYTTPQVMSAKFRVKSDGDYHLSFHIFESSPFYGAVIDSLSILEMTKFSAPDSVTNLKVSAGGNGALNATLNFIAPTKDYGGNALKSISKIEVKRDNDVLVKTFDNPKPGDALTCTDNGTDLLNDIHRYDVTAFSGDDKGVTATTKLFIGKDVPAAPTEVDATDNLDGTCHIEWIMPEKGANGGYVEKTKLKYYIYYYKEGEPVLLGSSISKSTNINIDAPAEQQQMVVFGVLASTDEGTGEITSSNEYIVGNPYQLPLVESFPDGQPESGIWITHDGVSGFKPENVEVNDNDGGAVFFSSTTSHDVASIESGKITLVNAANPELTYRYLAYPGDDVSLKILVRKNGEMHSDTLQTINYATLSGDNEWRVSTVSLAKYKDANYITVAFRGDVNDKSSAVVIDNIDIRDVKPYDLGASFANVPDTIVAGSAVTAYVKVKNLGDKDVANYKVKLFVNDVKVDEKDCSAINRYDVQSVALNYNSVVTDKNMTVYATVEADADGDISNNTTDTLNVFATAPDYPTVTDLTAVRDGDYVDLKWTPLKPQEESITEGFESYDAFAITNIGKWTLVDGDSKPSVGFKSGLFPHSGDPFAYIVFNPTKLGIDLDSNPNLAPNSGDQYLAAVTVEGKNDDWLISPELTGKAQSVTLYARSYLATYGKEKFEIRYSTTGKDTADFKSLVSTNEAPAAWTEYSAALPEGAKYFAIHYISFYDWMLMIDDITYTPKPLEVKGYNVYVDNKKIATTADATYIDGKADGGEHTYNVSVVYNEGESALSNNASVVATGISTMDGNGPQHADVYMLDGRCCFSGMISNVKDLKLSKGQYILRINGRTTKIVVK
jgi:hypothetical protein